MTTEATPGALGSNDQLGPPMEPVAWFRAPYGTLEPNPLFRVTGPQSLEWAVACFTEDQLHTAVAAEREKAAAEIERLQDTLKRQDKAHHQEVQEQVAAERERLAQKLADAEYIIGAFERGADPKDYGRDIHEFMA